ncbi:lactoylglutathione lyase-like lyase [Corynebacterium testudinoris]|uniref:Lactoylglutathione lyase-like lyase n=2 Tax=Corynebacterium testudinoris TaxID=136857 RepID=A0A0G3H347_9CORY|nr:lactoylglutathione lyase-like lyase [Corynebacterium testudinoris]
MGAAKSREEGVAITQRTYRVDMPVNVSRIDHLVLNCADVAVTAAWFQRALGMQVQQYGEGRTALVFGGQKINLRTTGATNWGTAKVDAPGTLDICFVTELTVEESLAAWEAAGIEIHEGPIQRSGALGPITSLYARDPDGNLIEVAHYGAGSTDEVL